MSETSWFGIRNGTGTKYGFSYERHTGPFFSSSEWHPRHSGVPVRSKRFVVLVRAQAIVYYYGLLGGDVAATQEKGGNARKKKRNKKWLSRSFFAFPALCCAALRQSGKRQASELAGSQIDNADAQKCSFLPATHDAPAV